MLHGNKLVIILPAVLVVFLFAGGSFYIQQAEVVQNDNLDEEIEWETSLEQTEKVSRLTAAWNWNATPDDGVQGNDYIGVTFIGENGETLSPDDIDHYQLKLEGGEDMEGKTVDNGIVFSFPNEVHENQVLGKSGSFTVDISNTSPTRAVISHLHTWESHEGLQSEDARFFEPQFVGKETSDESFYWVSERFVDVNEKGSSANK
ncbi:hypothetical protein SAMN05192534_106107 [Alteribacillus persepolensis]|uniref:Uncharacterized protein n=1 Tax=Alteribacillus persepolensis TaxID=568899 RepID=A0A1G8CWB9_9BACI|nr:hypothetical protein [Alteribacillus persepolensis]SDH49775.1 hypothetical protein SAMN05192534_106107 [Alteribacillus persepolensis]